MDQLFWTQSWKAINFTTFFEKLSAAVTTGQAEDEDNEEDGNDENDEDEESDINSYTTGSSQENQQEIHSESTLQEFFCNHPAKRESLDQLQLVHGNVRIQDLLCHASGSLIGYRTPTRLSTPLRVGTFRNDRPKKTMCNGGIVLSNPGAGRSQKPGNLPIISSEAKPRHLGSGVRYPTGEPEPYSTPTFAQELAELLGQAFACGKKSNGKWGDHDAWLVNIHGSRMRVINAFFSGSYLRQVNSPILRRNQRVLAWRSPQFNLKEPSERDQALRMALGFIRFLKSGNAVNAHLSIYVEPQPQPQL